MGRKGSRVPEAPLAGSALPQLRNDGSPARDEIREAIALALRLRAGLETPTGAARLVLQRLLLDEWPDDKGSLPTKR